MGATAGGGPRRIPASSLEGLSPAQQHFVDGTLYRLRGTAEEEAGSSMPPTNPRRPRRGRSRPEARDPPKGLAAPRPEAAPRDRLCLCPKLKKSLRGRACQDAGRDRNSRGATARPGLLHESDVREVSPRPSSPPAEDDHPVHGDFSATRPTRRRWSGSRTAACSTRTTPRTHFTASWRRNPLSTFSRTSSSRATAT